MAADSKTWSKRVAEWRESGLSAKDFASGKGYGAGSLYYWSHRFAHEPGAARPSPVVPLARVVRTEMPAESAAVLVERRGETDLALEYAGARVLVPSGFDPATLAAVLDVLDGRSSGATR